MPWQSGAGHASRLSDCAEIFGCDLTSASTSLHYTTDTHDETTQRPYHTDTPSPWDLPTLSTTVHSRVRLRPPPPAAPPTATTKRAQLTPHSARQLGQDSQLCRRVSRRHLLCACTSMMRRIWSVFMRRLKTPSNVYLQCAQRTSDIAAYPHTALYYSAVVEHR